MRTVARPLLSDRLSRHGFLGFDGGVHARRPAAIKGDPALELVDHLDGAVFDDVVDVSRCCGAAGR